MARRPLGAEGHKIAEWDQRRGKGADEFLAHMGPEQATAARESFYVGCWLEERLRERNASEQDIFDTCTASGQICFGREPWIVACIVLADYEEGVKYKPGLELADALLSGKLSEHFGPGGEARNAQELMKNLGVRSLQEVLDRFGVNTPEELEELKEVLQKKLEAEEEDMRRPR